MLFTHSSPPCARGRDSRVSGHFEWVHGLGSERVASAGAPPRRRATKEGAPAPTLTPDNSDNRITDERGVTAFFMALPHRRMLSRYRCYRGVDSEPRFRGERTLSGVLP
jgi:hypothetical protein